MKISVISGGFDPIHSGHISYINAAAQLGEKLIVLLNSDKWLQSKKGKEFMPFSERKTILENLKNVDEVMNFEDDHLGSCINGLKDILSKHPHDEVIFCNGGDRSKNNIPEMELKNINFEFSVGGNDKKNSSSKILLSYGLNTTEERIWGKFINLFEDQGIKVKELIVQPNSGMSYQRHFHRSEIWLVSRGACVVNFSRNQSNLRESTNLERFDHFFVNQEDWHQITNPFNETCHLIEIQYGEECVEEDIERADKL